MDLREFLFVIWKRRVAVILVVVLAALSGTAFALTRDPTYESTATISITPEAKQFGFVPAESLSALLGTYAETVQSDAVLSDAAVKLGHPVQGVVDGSSEEGTGILRIGVRASTREAAQESAGAVSEAFLDRIADDKSVVAQLVDPADRPSEPVQPRPPLIIGTSILVGIGVAVLLAVALERFRRRIVTAADLAEITQVPLLGRIPRVRELARSGPSIVWDKPSWTQLHEGFRSLRTNLQFVSGDSALAIQITSPGEGEGKSTVAANLAIAYAQVGVRTALLDADLRRPAQHAIFSIKNGPTAWGERSQSRSPMKSWGTVVPNLAVLPAGDPQSDPTEILSTKLPRLIERLHDSFELVLVDSPPLLPVSDARIIAAWMDAVVLIVSAGSERPSTLARAITDLDLAKANLTGVVLNQSVAPTDYGYYRPDLPLPELADRESLPVASSSRSSNRRD